MSAPTRILRRLEEDGPATRTELVQALQMPRGTVLWTAQELIDAGCVRVADEARRNRRGRLVQVLEVVPVLLALLLGACAAPTEPTVDQTFALVAFNGHEVPTLVVADTAGVTAVVRGTLTLGADGRFTEATVQVVRYTPTVSARTGLDSVAITVERIGTWSRRRDRVAFRLADGSGWDATVTGQQLRYAAGTQRFVWGRP